MNKSTPGTKKSMLMEQFISILIIFRVQLSDINIYVYYSLLFGFVVGKYVREGNTIGSLFQYIAIILLLFSDACAMPILSQVGIIIAVINYIFIAPTLYTLPDFSPKVGIRDNYIKLKNKDLYYSEWYPISQ
jgi:hypothetical protein